MSRHNLPPLDGPLQHDDTDSYTDTEHASNPEVTEETRCAAPRQRVRSVDGFFRSESPDTGPARPETTPQLPAPRMTETESKTAALTEIRTFPDPSSRDHTGDAVRKYAYMVIASLGTNPSDLEYCRRAVGDLCAVTSEISVNHKDGVACLLATTTVVADVVLLHCDASLTVSARGFMRTLAGLTRSGDPTPKLLASKCYDTLCEHGEDRDVALCCLSLMGALNAFTTDVGAELHNHKWDSFIIENHAHDAIVAYATLLFYKATAESPVHFRVVHTRVRYIATIMTANIDDETITHTALMILLGLSHHTRCHDALRSVPSVIIPGDDIPDPYARKIQREICDAVYPDLYTFASRASPGSSVDTRHRDGV